MAVESVNNNSNAGLYGLGGAVAGAGAGTATAYLTKSYLKDGIPTDEFSKKVYENIKDKIQKESKEFANVLKMAEEAKTVEEYRDCFVNNNAKKVNDIKKGGLLKPSIEDFLEALKVAGIEQEYIDKLKESKTEEEVKTVFGQIFDKQYAGKNIDEIKAAVKKEELEQKNKIGKFFFEQVWDKDKKEFKNCEEGIGKAIKDAAKSIQGKYALIYGSIAAAILGIITYFAASGNKSTQTPADKINTSV